MADKPVTLIVSDLHMGDGTPSDDFVDNADQFSRFVATQAATPEARAGKIELIINGDFLELAQVRPDLYQIDDKRFWASESESEQRVDAVAAGHPKVFRALAEFQALGNQVTLFPGNHDIDLVWPGVQKKMRALIPGVNIETDRDAYLRHGGRLHVAHGHLYPTIDPANGFKKLPHPILDDTNPPRLEMCPGTLFMLKFVNPMEAKYPFADNVGSIMDLIKILGREKLWGVTVLAWMLTRFAAKYPSEMLSADPKKIPVGAQVLDAIQSDKLVRGEIARLYADLLGERAVTAADVKRRLSSEDAVADFVERLFHADPKLDLWICVLDATQPATSSVNSATGGLLSILESGRTDSRNGCIIIAQARTKVGAQVIVLGHTHLPQDVPLDGARYYNPGSWTRYVVDATGLTLKDLEDESTFPYQLNYVRVEDTGAPMLSSAMINFEKQP